MLQKFTEHINQQFDFVIGKKILIAISGGLDSVVVTHLFNQIKIGEVYLAHCNFKLRKDASDLDEVFVKSLALKSSNQIFTTFFDTEKYALENKTSIQIAARELRYNWFQELIENHKLDHVVTAHHADDNLETFLINLTRGSGLDGFTGIPKQNGNIIRPLLPFSQNEILVYALENNLEWREDESNSETKYVRNKIRHQIVPVLKEINPSLLASFSDTINHLKESQEIIEDRIKEISKEVISTSGGNDDKILELNIKKIQILSNPKAYLYQLLKDYGFTEWNDVFHLLDAQSGKQVFSENYRLLKNRKFLLLSKQSTSSTKEIEYIIDKNDDKIEEPISLVFETVDSAATENKQTIYVDKDLLKYPLKVRKWRNGDYLYPIGMKGKKKLSKFFKDEKFSLFDKENIWLLCNAQNELIWVINHRQDRRFLGKKNLKITSSFK